MIVRLPADARPHEVGILYVYLTVTHNPQEIQEFLRYRSDSAVYAVLKKFRTFLAEQRRMTRATTLSC